VHRRQTYSKSQSSEEIEEVKTRPKIVGLTGESSKAEAFEHLQTLPSGRNQNLRRRSDNNH
jgi:hypothetical protein